MNIMNRIRLYHATLASGAILAYATGELGIIHAWLGYAVALVIVLRLLWALSGERQVGLMRFYPSFEGLRLNNAPTHPAITKTLMLGIALSLIAVTLTGIALDKGEAMGMKNSQIVASAYADDHEDSGKTESPMEEALEEAHEMFSSLLLMFVGLHVAYLLLFKRPLATFMLFIPRRLK